MCYFLTIYLMAYSFVQQSKMEKWDENEQNGSKTFRQLDNQVKQRWYKNIIQLSKQLTFNLELQRQHQEMLEQVILYSIIAVFIGISQSAGIGGGPVLNICLMIGAGYSAKQSMSITYLFLMGGAAASIIRNYGRCMPNSKTFIVDYDLIMITLPMSASGSLFGTLTNHFLSQLSITILFTILLSYLSVNTYNKLRTYSTIAGQKLKQTLLHKNVQLDDLKQTNHVSNAQLEQILANQQNPLPSDKIKTICFVFLYTLVALLLKGGHGYDSFIGINPCGIVGLVIVFIHFGLSFYCSKSMANKIVEKDHKKQELGYVYENQMDKMSQKKMWNSMISGFCAGLIGGALGLGGAIILVPVWLNSGIDQVKATSTSPPLIFFSALISFTICLLSGRYRNFVQLTFFFGLAYIGSAVVRSVVTYITQKYQLKSMIFVLLLITMISSLVALLPFQLSKFVKDPQTFLKFGEFC